MNLFLAKMSRKIGFVTAKLIYFECIYRIKVSGKSTILNFEKRFTDERLGGLAPTTLNLTELVALDEYTH